MKATDPDPDPLATDSSSRRSTEAPASKDTAAPTPNYIVLARAAGGEEPNVPWNVVGRYAGDGQRAAKKQAAQQPDVAKALADGNAIELVALPLSSWNPSVVQLEQLAPRVTGL